MTTGKPADLARGEPSAAGGEQRLWHTLTADEVAGALEADPTTGLTDAEAARRLVRYGPNALTAAEGRSDESAANR